MAIIEVYSKDYCPYCKAAKSLLEQLGWRYKEYEVTQNWKKHQEMIRRSGRKTVPQVFIDDQHIGGYDDFSAYVRRLAKVS